jgi:hypothetical protein
VRKHGGQPAPVAADGILLPLHKRPRLTTEAHTIRAGPFSRPAPIAQGGGEPPAHEGPFLSSTQEDDLSKYITRDSNRLQAVGFGKLVEEKRGRSNLNEKVH